jgi:5-methylcytosine-specific restriction enzyme subunit McrC
VIPDVLIERLSQPGISLPVDAKYKLYDERNMSSSDIYQTFLYAYAFGSEHAVLPTSLVVYPASSTEARQLHVHVRQRGGTTTSARVRGASIHIPSAIEETRQPQSGPISEKLREIIEEVFRTNGAQIE